MIFQDYYSTPLVRETCHQLKEAEAQGDRIEALERAARYLSEEGGIDNTCYLIPTPQHTGRAVYTRDLCEKISGMTAAAVLDIGSGTRDRTGCRNTAEQCRTDIRNTLRDELHIGTVLRADHTV